MIYPFKSGVVASLNLVEYPIKNDLLESPKISKIKNNSFYNILDNVSVIRSSLYWLLTDFHFQAN